MTILVKKMVGVTGVKPARPINFLPSEVQVFGIAEWISRLSNEA